MSGANVNLSTYAAEEFVVMEKTDEISGLNHSLLQPKKSKILAFIESQFMIIRRIAYLLFRRIKQHVISSVRTTLRSKRLYALDMMAAMVALVLATALRLGHLSSMWTSAFDA